MKGNGDRYVDSQIALHDIMVERQPGRAGPCDYLISTKKGVPL